MAKNNSGLIMGGTFYSPSSAKAAFQRKALKFAEELQHRVEISGGAAANKAAHDLLSAAQADCPEGVTSNVVKEWSKATSKKKGFNSRSFNNRLDQFGVQYIKPKVKGSGFYEKLMFRDTRGRFNKSLVSYVSYGKSKSGEKEVYFDHNTGSLRASGRVQEIKDNGKTSYVVSFDTRRTDAKSLASNFNYAIIQHDDLTYKHSNGKAYFLRDNYIKLLTKGLDDIADEVGKSLKGVKLF